MNLILDRFGKHTALKTFDFLRGEVERYSPAPAILTLTSSTGDDGKEQVARALAASLAHAGYVTLLIDTSIFGGSTQRSHDTSFEEIADQLQVRRDPTDAYLTLGFGDEAFQGRTSQRSVESALKILAAKFDYVITTADFRASVSFPASIVAASDAVIVSVRKGRRKTEADVALARSLGEAPERFVGVISVDEALLADLRTQASKESLETRRPTPALDRSHGRLDATEPRKLVV